MSRIDELIAELAPNGVEFRKLRDIEAIQRGKRLVRNQLLGSGEIPVYQNSMAPLGYYREANVGAGRTFIIAAGAAGEIGYSDVDFWAADDVYFYPEISDVDQKYLYYVLQSKSGLIKSRVRRASIPRLPKNAIEDIRIPVPPLEMQREIVRALDQFTQLEAELEAELEARRRQYEHYRVVLLNSSDDGGVRDVSLGEIIRLNFGARITKKDNAGTIYPVYGGGGESFRTDAFNREDEWVISRFAMSANCVRRVTGKFWMLDSGFTFDVTDATVDKDFVGQLLLSMQPTIFATSTQSAQKNIDVDGFKRLRVQIPSLDTQRRVASALANFDGIVNDLSSGLPAELAARRKQYEYYRDKLLTFEEAAA